VIRILHAIAKAAFTSSTLSIPTAEVHALISSELAVSLFALVTAVQATRDSAMNANLIVLILVNAYEESIQATSKIDKNAKARRIAPIK
jgi:hypothetical protein